MARISEIHSKDGINEWKNGPKIIKADLINGSECIIKCTAAEVLSNKEHKNSSGESIMTFGKFKGRTIIWMKENQSGYLEWCRENVKNFSY